MNERIRLHVAALLVDVAYGGALFAQWLARRCEALSAYAFRLSGES